MKNRRILFLDDVVGPQSLIMDDIGIELVRVYDVRGAIQEIEKGVPFDCFMLDYQLDYGNSKSLIDYMAIEQVNVPYIMGISSSVAYSQDLLQHIENNITHYKPITSIDSRIKYRIDYGEKYELKTIYHDILMDIENALPPTKSKPTIAGLSRLTKAGLIILTVTSISAFLSFILI